MDSAPLTDTRYTRREMQRLQTTAAFVPEDARTGLEIGFHDFRATDMLSAKLDLVSTDLPSAVKDPGCRKLAFADIRNLPFPDMSFDVVICTEVLEHLPEETIARGVRELVRVSRKYLLISVPYQQRVWNEMFKCAHCGYVYNNVDHLHYFDEHRLLGLFPGATLKRKQLVGQLDGYAPDWLYACARTLGSVWCEYRWDTCPGCSRNAQVPRPNAVGWVLQRVLWRAEKHATRRPAWILVLLQLR